LTPAEKPLSEVVDDPLWAEYLPGTWVEYRDGEDYKYSRDKYIFLATSDSFDHHYSVNEYYTFISPDYSYYKWRFSIEDSILYIPIGSRLEKYARLAPIDHEIMYFYRIIENSSSYTEYPRLLTKAEFIESGMDTDGSILPELIIYQWSGQNYFGDSIIWDFSAGKNWFTVRTTKSTGAVSEKKYHYKIRDSILYYRLWDSDWDPTYDDYAMEISGASMSLYNVVNGTASTYPSLSLSK
jgi:hypothetical protein